MPERSPQQALQSNAPATGHAQNPPRVGSTASQRWNQGGHALPGKAVDHPGSRSSVFRSSAWIALVALGPRGIPGILVVVVGLMAGCTGFSSAPPPLADSTFARVLVDLHLAQNRHRTHANQSAAPPPPRDSIFAHHSIRATAFEATLRHYSRRPEALAGIYQSVIDTLTARQQAAQRAARAASVASGDSATAPAAPRP